MKTSFKSVFIRCSLLIVAVWSGAASSAPPEAATLVSPSGTISNTTPGYSWNAVPGSTWYYLWVQDSSGVKARIWYTAAQSGCSAGVGECTVTPTQAVSKGISRFWIRTWNAEGVGPWSDALVFKVGNAPIAATLLAPSGNIMDTTPAYSWNAVPGATWYYLWVQDSGGIKVQTWYTAAQAGCAGGAGTCSVTPAVTLNFGNAKYWIKTWNSIGTGPWSVVGNFIVSFANPDTVACAAPNAETQAALLAATNAIRATPTVCNGITLPAQLPLVWNSQLGNSAQAHSDDMAANNYFSHTGQNGSNFSTRAASAGYTGFASGENIAAGSSTVGPTMLQWLNSTTGHCEHLMTANANEVGAGCGLNVNAQFTYYWTFVTGISGN
ncbi:MAG: CAP domain-containing protein [Granulosicoccus sp.]